MRGMPAEIGQIVPQGCMATPALVDGLAEDPGDNTEDAHMAIFALRESIADFDERIDVPGAECGRRPRSTWTPDASGPFRA